ncbi:MAG: SpoIIE family protein phosphatase [Verrucomicrobia bacterium]|nr:SpoIIE family protein phosphatase [Verrucomicrobiota bacterium]
MTDVVTPHTNQIGAQFLSLVFACDLRESREVSRCVRQFLAAVPLPEDDLHAWELMVTEAANNAAEYVAEEGRQLSNRLEVFCRDHEIEVRLTDHTPGFDMPAQAELPSIDSEKGRGLFLIQSLADEVEYLRGRAENCMVIRKKRPAPVAGTRAAAEPVVDLGSRFIGDEQTLQAMTEELASCYESLSAIFRFTSALNRPQPTEEFTATWMRELLAIVEADWYVLRLADPGGKELRISATSLPGSLDYSLSLSPDVSLANSVELRAAQSRQDVWFDANAPLAMSDPLSHVVRHSNGLAHPIFSEESLVGVLAIGRLSSDAPFKASQASVIQTFADFLGIQISNARFRAEHLQAQLTARELQIASNLQRSLLPEKLPQMPGLGVAGYYHSARQVGGDFYDAIAADGQGLLLVIADVMGKGVPAAMFATIFRSHLHARLDLVKRPGEFLTWLNRSLFSDLDRMEMFITAQLVYVDPVARRFQVAGAGHCPLLMTSAGGTPVEVGNTGFPLGIMPDTRYSEEVRDLPPGARLLLYTDGVTDTQNASDEMLGAERLKQNLQQIINRCGNTAQTVQDMAVMLQAFQGKELAADDQAFLVLASE